jgi:hypothetical protein
MLELLLLTSDQKTLNIISLTAELPPGPVKSFDMNTLQSNNPIEDAHAEAGKQNINMVYVENSDMIHGSNW